MIIRKSKPSPATKRTVSSIWKKITTIRVLKQIHAHMIVHGFESDLSALRELVFSSAITIRGNMNYARKIFDDISNPDVFIWNTIIRGFSQSSDPLEAIHLYTHMEKTSAKPDSFTFPFLLKACASISLASMGNQIHGRVVKFGLQSDVFVRNTLIHLYAGCGSLDDARQLFDEMAQRDIVAWSALTAGYARRGRIHEARKLFDMMPERDLISWNVMVTAYTKCGDMESARKLFEDIPQRDIVSWNTMFSGYVLCGEQGRALELFEEMQEAGERPDEVTILSLLSACADAGELDAGKRIHSLLEANAVIELSIVVGNSLIDMYAKCGSIENSMMVFSKMRERDISSWNSVIGALAFHGHAEEALSLFEEMQRKRMVKPNEITFVAVLVACSHAGKVEEGRRWFDIMSQEYNIEPNIKHYGCMVDMLGRAGLLREASDFIEGMKVGPNAIIWRTLLGACRTHGDLQLAKHATKKLLQLRPDQSGDYVLLSNIYASSGKWDGAEEVRKVMGDRRVKKEPGCSLIEVNNELLHFLLDKKPLQPVGPRTVP